MKKNIKKSINLFVKEMIILLQDTKQLAKTQLPDISLEIITFYKIYHSLGILFSLLFLLIPYKMYLYGLTLTWADQEERLIFLLILGIFSIIILSIIFFINFFNLLQLLVSPKHYLIEYFSNLIK